MRKIICVLACCLMATLAYSSDLIEDFGLNGSRAPMLLGDPLPESFMTMSQTKAIASGFHYTGYMDIEEGRHSHLTLVNTSEKSNSVVVSAVREKTNSVRNFVITLAGDEFMTLDISGLNESNTIYLISMMPFEAVSGIGDWDAEDIEITAPVRRFEEPQSEATNYCQNLVVSRTITNDSNGASVSAWFERTGPKTVGNRDHYGLNVYYPTYTPKDLFHRKGGTTGYPPHPPCKMLSVGTWQVTTNKQLTWTNKDDHWDGIDEVWFSNARGQARCASTGQTWTIQ